MSQENVELVKRCYEALNEAYWSGEYGGWIEGFAHPDVRLRTSGMFPESGEYCGYQGGASVCGKPGRGFRGDVRSTS